MVWLRRIVLLLLAVPAAYTATDLKPIVREAAQHENPISTLVDRVPPGVPVDIVMLTPGGREFAVFLGADLAPRDVRFFDGWDAWRARRRAEFIHDSRGVNAPPGPPPGPAGVVIEAGEVVRIVSPP